MAAPRMISMSEVKKHNTRESLWMVISNSVYDVTSFVQEHPGGEDALTDHGGVDATIPFTDVGHSQDAKDLMKKFKIGELIVEKKCECKYKKFLPHMLIAISAGVIVGIIIKKLIR